MTQRLIYRNDFYPLTKTSDTTCIDRYCQSSTGFFETIIFANVSPDVLAAGALVSWLFGTFAVILIWYVKFD